MNRQALYTFTWNEGGFNQVWANTKAEAIEKIKREFACCGIELTPNWNSLKRVSSKAKQEAYFANIPYMD